MALADELPAEAIEAFQSALLTQQQRRKGGTVKQLQVRNEKQLRGAIAAAIEKVPLGTLIGVGGDAQVQLASATVLGIKMEDPAPPEGWTPEGALILVRGEDPAGERAIFWRQAGDVTLWEMVGMLECAGDAVREQIAEARTA